MNDSQFNPQLYRKYNENEFQKVTFICDEFPTVFGEILVAKFADGGTVKIGKNVTINSAFWANPVGGTQTCFLIKGEDALINIGNNVGMSNVLLAARVSIKIHDNVNLGGGVKIFDTDFHSVDLQERLDDVNIPKKAVVIEEGCFLGADVIILKGVTIGKESVVGAGSVVAKSIPPGEIWGGNPAKFIKKLTNKEKVQ
ncbi:MAG: acyltransferase [Verrucomicrobiota bacterium]|nr:acyltransferase [Verrucomicrobiota bacterium]